MTNPIGSSGLTLVDQLFAGTTPTLPDYIAAASDYVLRSRSLTEGQKKTCQIRLSAGLARALVLELHAAVPEMHLIPGEREVSGALRTVKADISEIHSLDGLRLAVEIKPVNLAVGRAIWNRFGDIRTFAVNVHLKFPFAVLGGLLAIPTFEEFASTRRTTLPVVGRAVERLARAGGRRTEADAAHLLEGVGVIIYDPDSSTLHPELPPVGSGLRWDEFVQSLASAYRARFVF